MARQPGQPEPQQALLASLLSQAVALGELARRVAEESEAVPPQSPSSGRQPSAEPPRARELENAEPKLDPLAAELPQIQRKLEALGLNQQMPEVSHSCPDAAAGDPYPTGDLPPLHRPEPLELTSAGAEDAVEEGRDSDDEEDDDDAAGCGGNTPTNALELHEVWKQRRRRHKHRANRGSLAVQNSRVCLSMSSSGSLDTGRRRRQWPCAKWVENNLVVHPTSKKRLCWELVGMICVGYDLLTLPLATAFESFETSGRHFSAQVAWVTAAFWSLDMFRTFLLGFHDRGRVKMSLLPIARRYLTTWFLFDITVVSIDWAVLIAISANNDQGYLRLGRVLRFLRMARLLRLLKVHGTLAEVYERVQSESFRIFLGIARLLVYIILCNHVLACGFYGVGTLGDEFNAADTWVKANGLPDRSFWYRYSTSLHWSLTQFTPASMEVVPRNTLERAYAVCTVLFALVTFSSFVSSLTGAMTELRNLNSERLEKCMVLRRYLRENKIDASVTARIWGWLEHKPTQIRRRTRSVDVDMLATLPRRLQIELLQQIYEPMLIRHPFFSRFSQMRSIEMRFIYECLHEISVGMGHEVFAEGQVSEHMFFVFEGSLSYLYGDPDRYADQDWQPERRCSWVSTLSDPDSPLRRQSSFSSSVFGCAADSAHTEVVSNDDAVPVAAGSWMCEAALWFCWKHVGMLTAAANSELIGLHSPRLLNVMTCELRDVWEPGKYARLLLRFVERRGVRLCDLWADMCTLEDLAAATFDADGDADEALRGSRWAQDILPQLHPALTGIRQRMSITSLLTTSTQGDLMSRRSSLASSARSQGSIISSVVPSSVSSDSSSLDNHGDKERRCSRNLTGLSEMSLGVDPLEASEQPRDPRAAPKRVSFQSDARPSVSAAAARRSGPRASTFAAGAGVFPMAHPPAQRRSSASAAEDAARPTRIPAAGSGASASAGGRAAAPGRLDRGAAPRVAAGAGAPRRWSMPASAAPSRHQPGAGAGGQRRTLPGRGRPSLDSIPQSP